MEAIMGEAKRRHVAQFCTDISDAEKTRFKAAAEKWDSEWGDEQMDNDRIWFEQHPGREYRMRLPFGEELHLMWGSGEPGMVLVRQVRPGHRNRAPIQFPLLMPGGVYKGEVVKEPVPIRLPASEIYAMDDAQCSWFLESQLAGKRVFTMRATSN
jgi:hypothetical protein